jgi:predicted nucleic acid-binding protein
LPDLICDTSALQYLHQLGLLHILTALADRVTVTPAVAAELSEGRSRGIDVPELSDFDWLSLRSPASTVLLPQARDLGEGETEVLALALESHDAVVVLDDRLARRVADELGLRLTGPLGLLIDAKKKGLVSKIEPLLDQLQSLRFRLSPATRAAVLKLVGEVEY